MNPKAEVFEDGAGARLLPSMKREFPWEAS